MDPLSVAASVTGLLTASMEVAKLFAAFRDGYDYARAVHDEIHHFRFILFELYKYLHSDSLNIARASMIDLDQVVQVILGCMYTFSELEREVERIKSRPERLRRIWWGMAKSSLVDLVQRLQNHKGTISFMISILNSGSQNEAVSCMHGLRKEVAELGRNNAELARKLDLVTAGSASSSGASVIRSVITTRSVLSISSVRTNFQITLNNSRVYRRTLLGRVNKAMSATGQASAPSIQQSWSVLSGLSLSEVSNYSVYSLPISPQELYNPTYYTTSGQVVALDPNMPEIPILLTTAFAESLKIALKQYDAETAKKIANYIPWEAILKMSAVYPTLAADPSNNPGKELDRLTLFKLWLQCGGETEAKDRHGRTAIGRAMEDEDWGMFKLLLQNGSDLNSTYKSKTALHLISAGSAEAESLVLGLWEDMEEDDRAKRDPIGFSLEHKYIEAVRTLLSHGADVEAKDGLEATALHYASMRGNNDVVGILLSHGADANVKDGSEATALHHASMRGNNDMVEILLRHGADVNAKDKEAATVLHYASENGHKGVVEVLLSHGADVHAKGTREKTALHYASDNGHTDVVEVLLRHRADAHAKDTWEQTALHYASENGHKDVVEVLLSHGADSNAKSISKLTALNCASSSGQKDVVEVLLSHGADAHAKDTNEMTALHYASRGGHKDVVEVLLSHGADSNSKSNSKLTALHCASSSGQKDVVKVLLSRGADVHAKDTSEATALHYASSSGVVEILLSNGADVNAKDTNEMTALHHASRGGHKDVVEVLLSHGADVHAKDTSEATALHYTSSSGVVEVLLSNGADVKAKDTNEMTALHHASRGGHKDVVEVLLSHGEDDRAMEILEATALHPTLIGNVVENLVRNKAYANTKDTNEMTALHHASRSGHKDVVEVLLSHRVDFDARDTGKMTALHHASESGHQDVVQVLLSHRAEANARDTRMMNIFG